MFFKTTFLATVPFCHQSSLFRDTVRVYMHSQVCTAQIYIYIHDVIVTDSVSQLLYVCKGYVN